MTDTKELDALLHQSEMFTPHLVKQLQHLEKSCDQKKISVLDIGCGPCPSHATLLSQLDSKLKSVLAVDCSQTWINYCRQKFTSNKVHFLHANLRNTKIVTLRKHAGLEEEVFTLGLCLFSVQTLNAMFEFDAESVNSFEFILIHAFTIDVDQNKNDPVLFFFKSSLSKRIRENFSIFVGLHCPVELDSGLSQELETKLKHASKGQHTAAHLREWQKKTLNSTKMCFVSLLLKAKIPP